MAYQITYWKRYFFLLCLLGFLATACEPNPAANPSYLKPCPPPTDGVNIYKKESEQYPDGSIFIEAFQTGEPYFYDLDIRRRALYTLKEQVRRWSSYRDILVNDDQVIRITLIFIHPELVEIIYLNQVLAQPTIIGREQFAAELQTHLENLGAHNELYFLVTFTDSNYKPLITAKDGVILNIPMKNITLMNSENKYVKPTHFDPPLGQDIQISRKHLSGYIAFPMFVQENSDQCALMLDPFSNTTITLAVNGIKLSTTSSNFNTHKLTWFIRYHSLLDINTVPTPAFVLDPNTVPECCQFPPTPEITVAEPSDAYWVEMARYVWGYEVTP